MRAVVLVGGFGTRLRPLTFTTPKPLLPVGHVPIVELVVGSLARAGITEAVLAIGFKPDVFRAAYPDGICAGVPLVYAVEPEPLDTAGAIRFAARHAGIDDTFVVVNGDILTDLDVSSLVAFHRDRGAEATIHLTPVEDPSAFGVVPTDEEGRVLAFIEKPTREEAPTNLINGGTYVIEPSVVDRIASDRKVSIERETFPAVVERASLYAMATDDYWLDTGRPELYLQANFDVLDGKRRHDRCEPLGVGAAARPGSTVTHSVIGAGGVVAEGAAVVDSVLLSDVVVGSQAVVRSSVIGTSSVVGSGALVQDAVIGDGVEVEAGARLIGVRVPDPG